MHIRVFLLRICVVGTLASAVGACANDPADVMSQAVPGRGGPPVEYTAALPGSESGWETASVVRADSSDGGPEAGEGAGPYLLDTGDRLRVFVYGQPNLSRAYVVDQSGHITVPLIGSVTARGVTTRDLQHIIADKLGRDYVRDPQVTVDILQNRPFFILGEVKAAGQYPYVSGMTIETAVAIAGGYSDRASDGRFRITHRTNGYVEQIEVANDYLVQPGDTVYVYERLF